MRVRIPSWSESGARVKINGDAIEASASPGSYLTITRTWKTGDRVELGMPLSLRVEKMPDEPTMQAFLYGPFVLAGDIGSEDLKKDLITGPASPDIKTHPMNVPTFRAAGIDPNSWIKAADKPLTFRTTGQARDVTLAPFDRTFGVRYSVYWTVS
jgi:DUF1680 family protein